MKTSRALAIAQPRSPVVLSERARKYARKSKSNATLIRYGSAWREFEQFARSRHERAMPAEPETVIDFLTTLADSGAAYSTIAVDRAAIVYAHRLEHQPDPTDCEEVIAVMSGIGRAIGIGQKQKSALTLRELRRLVRVIPNTPRGRRDRALILLGYACAFRRSELVALDVRDIEIADALRVTVRRSKTDQTGAGFVKVVPLDVPAEINPADALRSYMTESGITKGPVFRSGRWHLSDKRLTPQMVNITLKRYAKIAGLDPEKFSAHSLRAGFSTTAYDNGAKTFEIMEQTGHKSERMLSRYVRMAGRGAQNAVRAAFQE